MLISVFVVCGSDVLFDIRVMDTDARSYLDRSVAVIKTALADKKKKPV